MHGLLLLARGIGIVGQDIEELDGVIIDRDLLIEPQRYEMAKVYFPRLRALFSSSYLTSLQGPAAAGQKWPLINLLRQILKHCNYRLCPKRVCNGYTKAGKKSFKRVFLVQKLMTLTPGVESQVHEPDCIE